MLRPDPANRISVAILIDTLAVGGPGKGVLQIARHLNACGVRYQIYAFHYGAGKKHGFIEQARKELANLSVIDVRRRFDGSAVRRLCNAIVNDQHTIVQTHGYKTHLAGMALRKKLNWIAVLHGWTSGGTLMRLYNGLERRLVRYPQLVIAVSAPLADFARSARPAKPTWLIPNAVDPGAYVNCITPFNSSVPTIAVIGRLSREKGQLFFLDALSKLGNPKPPCNTLIIGEGPERQKLMDRTTELGLQKHVRFTGYQSDIRTCLQQTDILVNPAESEGCPNVVLEAMASRIPVVATAVGGVPDLIEHRLSGWLVPFGDTDALVHSVHECMQDDAIRQRCVAGAIAFVRENHNPRARADQFLEAYAAVSEKVA